MNPRAHEKYWTDCARNAPAKTRVQEKQAIRSTLFQCMACDDSKKKFKMAARARFKGLSRNGE